MVTLDCLSLQNLLSQNSFVLPSGIDLCFVGLRGALPAAGSDLEFRKSHRLDLVDVNYVHARCTLVQWRVAAGEIAIFPGSTVPHLKEVRRALQSNGQGANQLLTGFHRDFVKGAHSPSPQNTHQAFVQGGAWPFRRTADNTVYENTDRLEVALVWDNLHAAWSPDPITPVFESAGCQVVCGMPDTPRRRAQGLTESGPWARFRQNAYALPQTRFPYVLLEARDLQGSGSKLRFGSQGPRVNALQGALTGRGFYKGPISGQFGPDTLRAVINFQESLFGPAQDDGIVGRGTAEALNVKL